MANTAGRGSVTPQAFREIVRKFGLPLRGPELEALRLRYAASDDGDLLDYNALLAAVKCGPVGGGVALNSGCFCLLCATALSGQASQWSF